MVVRPAECAGGELVEPGRYGGPMADFELSTLHVTVDGPVARLTLNRPTRLNALSRTALAELAEAAHWLDGRRDVKTAVVHGEGRAFCAGFDLDDFTNADPDAPTTDGAELGRRMADAITDMRALTVAAVQGWCVGGGLVLAAACDLRLAASDARFSIPEVDLGIPLAWGGIPRLVRELGPAITKELVLTCRTFDAAEAHALRFLNRVVAPDALLTSAVELATALATKSSLTLVQTKSHVNAVAEQMGSTAGSGVDALVLAAALADPESRAAGRAYTASKGRR
jgi:enoyl-CoA hydratase/carnithine racemase